MGCGGWCRRQRNYKYLIKMVYPPDPKSAPRSPAKLLQYMSQEKKRIPAIARHLSKRLARHLHRAEHTHVEVTMMLVDEMVRRADLSLFSSYVIAMVDLLLKQPRAQHRMLGLDTLVGLMKYRNNDDLYRDEARVSGMVPAIVAMCQFEEGVHEVAGQSSKGSGGSLAVLGSQSDLAYTGTKYRDVDLTSQARRCALLALLQLAVSMPEVFEKHMDTILPPLLLNAQASEEPLHPGAPADVPAASSPANPGEDVEMVEMDHERSLSALAHEVVGTIASLHNVLIVMNLVENLIAALDAQNLWVSKGETVREIMSTLSRRMQTHHNHIIFSHLFRRLDDDSAQPMVKLSVLDVVTFCSRNVHPAGTWVLEGLNTVSRHLAAVFVDPMRSRTTAAEQLLLRKTHLVCLSALASRLQVPSQAAEVLLMILQRLPSVKRVLEMHPGQLAAIPHNPTDEEQRAQAALTEAAVVVADAAPSIRPFPTTSTSPILNTLLHASLANDPQTRLLALKLLHSLFCDSPVNVTEQMVENRDTGGQFEIQSFESPPNTLRFRVHCRSAPSPVPSPLLSARTERSPRFGVKVVKKAALRKDSIQILACREEAWGGHKRDWHNLYDVLYQHIVSPDNTASIAAYLSLLLAVLLSRHSDTHIAKIVPLLLTAQQALANSAGQDKCVESTNASHMLILSHMLMVAEVSGNDELSVHCQSILVQRENAKQMHPRITHSVSGLVLRDEQAEEAIVPVTVLLDPEFVCKSFPEDREEGGLDVSIPFQPPANLNLLRPTRGEGQSIRIAPRHTDMEDADEQGAELSMRALLRASESVEENKRGGVNSRTDYNQLLQHALQTEGIPKRANQQQQQRQDFEGASAKARFGFNFSHVDPNKEPETSPSSRASAAQEEPDELQLDGDGSPSPRPLANVPAPTP